MFLSFNFNCKIAENLSKQTKPALTTQIKSSDKRAPCKYTLLRPILHQIPIARDPLVHAIEWGQILWQSKNCLRRFRARKIDTCVVSLRLSLFVSRAAFYWRCENKARKPGSKHLSRASCEDVQTAKCFECTRFFFGKIPSTCCATVAEKDNWSTIFMSSKRDGCVVIFTNSLHFNFMTGNSI